MQHYSLWKKVDQGLHKELLLLYLSFINLPISLPKRAQLLKILLCFVLCIYKYIYNQNRSNHNQKDQYTTKMDPNCIIVRKFPLQLIKKSADERCDFSFLLLLVLYRTNCTKYLKQRHAWQKISKVLCISYQRNLT